MDKPVYRSKNHALIHHALIDPATCYWPKEIRLAKKLIQQFPDLNFWRDSAHLIFKKKPRSLTAYLVDSNIKLLKDKYHSYSKLKDLDFQKKSCYTLEKGRIGEDKVFEKKPKSILDFIRDGQNKKE